MSDSLLSAAKALSEATSVPWGRVNAVYRELQEAGELPVSVGRRIWYASPQLVARLLIGIAGELVMIGAVPAVAAYRAAVSPDGETLEDALARELIGTSEASLFGLGGLGSAATVFNESGMVQFNPALSFLGEMVDRDFAVSLNVAVNIRAFEHMRAAVAWRRADEPPYGPPSSFAARA